MASVEMMALATSVSHNPLYSILHVDYACVRQKWWWRKAFQPISRGSRNW